MAPRGRGCSAGLGTLGGPLLYLVVQTGYMTLVIRTRSRARVVAMAVLALAAGLALFLPPRVSLALVTAILTTLVVTVLHEQVER